MKQYLIILLVSLTHLPLYSQLSNEQGVIQELLYYLRPDNCSSKSYYVKDYSIKTYFNISQFKQQTLLSDQVSETVLKELSKYPSKDAYLDTSMLDTSEVSSLRIYKSGTERPKGLVISFTKPLFDKSKSHCVITVSQSFTKGAFISDDYFLAKIYGKWVVLDTFNHITT